MKKLLLFFAALCCALGVSAGTVTYYDELPSGTGVYERTIVNIEYNNELGMLTFDDTYLPTFTAYKRSYYVYFSEWKPEYKYWENNNNFGYSVVEYGNVETGQSSLVKVPGLSTDTDNPVAQYFATKVNSNSNGGHVTIFLSTALSKLRKASSSKEFLVSIAATYTVAEGAESTGYSKYNGNWEASFLLNSKHISTSASATANSISVSPVIVNVKNSQGNVAPENPKGVEIAANGTDAVRLGAEIATTMDVENDVAYTWEYRDDNNMVWKELSKGVVSKDDFNSFASNRKIPFASVSFTADDKPINVRYVRVSLNTEDKKVEFVYQSEVALYLPEANFDLFIQGKQITSKNCNDYYGNGNKDIVYDPASNTLTLKNVNETNMGEDFIVSYGSGQPLNICVIGDCRIYNQGTGYAIRSDYKDVRIYGEGKLEIVRGDGICCESNLSLTDGVTVDIDSYMQNASGISLYGEGVLTVDNATLTAKGTPSIWNVKNLVMKNGVNILSAGHKFDAAKKAVVDASGNATSETVKIGVGTPDAIQNVVTEKASQNGKFVRNNQLLIKRGAEYYNAQGVKVSATR